MSSKIIQTMCKWLKHRTTLFMPSIDTNYYMWLANHTHVKIVRGRWAVTLLSKLEIWPDPFCIDPAPVVWLDDHALCIVTIIAGRKLLYIGLLHFLPSELNSYGYRQLLFNYVFFFARKDRSAFQDGYTISKYYFYLFLYFPISFVEKRGRYNDMERERERNGEVCRSFSEDRVYQYSTMAFRKPLRTFTLPWNPAKVNRTCIKCTTYIIIEQKSDTGLKQV